MTDAERDHQPVRAVRNIADPYLDLLAALGDAQRRGMVHRLSVGFYEGWSPTRAEVARLVDVELGRITEDEYLLSGHSEQRAQQYLPSTGGSPLTAGGGPVVGTAGHPATRGAGNRDRPEAAGRAKSWRSAAFRVDCGVLAPPFRLLATQLSSPGWTFREGTRYRMVALHYELVLSTVGIAGPTRKTTPVAFSAPITCLPDSAAPPSINDGSEQQHTVGVRGISGSRGMWPVAEDVHRVCFLIGQQLASGTRQTRHPAGTLRVDLRRGVAMWRGANRGRVTV